MVEALDVKEAILIDSRACLNIISPKVLQQLGQMKVDSPQIWTQSFIRHTTKFASEAYLNIKVKEFNSLEKFYGVAKRDDEWDHSRITMAKKTSRNPRLEWGCNLFLFRTLRASWKKFA